MTIKVVGYFAFEKKVDRTGPASFIALERLAKSFWKGWRCSWNSTLENSNQDISWHIKRKILIAMLAFIWIFHLSFFFGISFVGII